MTREELKAEYRYRYQERLGMLCATAEPSKEEIKIAESEALEAVERIRNEANRQRSAGSEQQA